MSGNQLHKFLEPALGGREARARTVRTGTGMVLVVTLGYIALELRNVIILWMILLIFHLFLNCLHFIIVITHVRLFSHICCLFHLILNFLPVCIGTL